MNLTLTSYGHLHRQPPDADRVEDVRELRDPAAAEDIQGILDLDGDDPRVQAIVENTPGARALLDKLVDYVERCRPIHIAIGCAGGRHRAPALVNLLAKRLRARGHLVTVEHLDIHRPRVLTAN